MDEKIQERISYQKIACALLFCLCSFAINLYSAQLSPLAEQLMEQFHITKSQYTSLYMSTLLPSLFLGIPFTWLVRRYGIKGCQSVGLFIGFTGLCLRIFCSRFIVFYFSTLLIGFSNIVISTMGVTTFSKIFKKENVGIAIGCMIAFGAGGKAVAEATTSLFPGFLSMSLLDICIQSILFVAWLLLMKDYKVSDSYHTVGQTFQQVLRDKYIWIGAVALMLVFGLYTGMSAHLPSILHGKGYSLLQAGAMTSVISIGYFLGAIFLPRIASVLKNQKMFMSMLAIISSLCTVVLAVKNEMMILISSILGVGICVGGLLPLTLTIPVTMLHFNTQKNQVSGSLFTTFQLGGAVLIPAYIIIPLAGNHINRILLYTALLMLVEGVLFACMPQNQYKGKDN